MEVSDFRSLLTQEYTSRRLKNQSYSIRAFARDLGICKSSLSYVLSGQRDLAEKTKQQVIEKLALSPKEVALLLNQEGSSYELDEEHFRLIADWYCFAVYGLLKTKEARADVNWISERLHITKTEAQMALDVLIKLELIEIKNQKVIHSRKVIKTSEDISSRALKHHHKQNLERAKQSLENDSVTLREFTSITVPADPDEIENIKQEIRKLRNKLLKMMEKQRPKEVYTLAIQLFPQSFKRREK